MATLLDAFPFANTLRDAVFLSATVSEIEQLTPRIRRIRFAGPRLRGLASKPGQQVRLQVAGLAEAILRLHPHDAVRTFSIYDADPGAGTLDVAIFDHDGDPHALTPAKQWASTISVGDEVRMIRPQGNFVIRPDAPYHVFVGEETASVAFAAMLRSLPSSAEVHGVIEGATQADHLPLARSITHIERGDAPAANSVLLTDTVRTLPLPDHPGVAYLAGEARTIQAVRKVLIAERGWDRRNIHTKPFWTPGRRGME